MTRPLWLESFKEVQVSSSILRRLKHLRHCFLKTHLLGFMMAELIPFKFAFFTVGFEGARTGFQYLLHSSSEFDL